MPQAIQAWESALRTVMLPTFSVEEKRRQGIIAKTLFPPVDIILKGDMAKSAQRSNNWMLSRAGVQWMQDRPDASPCEFPKRFWNELVHHGFATGRRTEMRENKKEDIERWMQHYGVSFNQDGVLSINGASLSVPARQTGQLRWKDELITLQEGRLPAGFTVAEVLWELAQLNFRFDLLKLDGRLYRPVNLRPEDWDNRYLKMDRLLGEESHSESLAYYPFPKFDDGISHTDREVQKTFLHLFAHFQSDWRRPFPPWLSQWCANKESVPVPELEAGLFSHFCQCFVDEFGTIPSVPRRLPARPIPDASPS